MIEFVDTHCHVHFLDYELDAEKVINDALANGVTRMICVGRTLADSELGVEMANRYKNIWASIGIHPHDAKLYTENPTALQQLRELANKPRVIAVGEIGLDYFYNYSPKSDQAMMLRYQLDLAQEYDLPIIFHVREAFDDFFAIFDEYVDLRGVVHSFTANTEVLEKCLNRGLYVGLNGIMTFTKDKKQLEMLQKVPQNRMLLETDAPFLTPMPFRGTICQPKHVVSTAEFIANLRGESLEDLATATTQNALALFKL